MEKSDWKEIRYAGLRNPDHRPQSITLDAQRVFELPAGNLREVVLKPAYQVQRVACLDQVVGKPITIELQSFIVLVFDTEI